MGKSVTGAVAGGLLGGAGGALTGGLLGGSFGGGKVHAPQIGGQQRPLDMLTSTGGAPLLMNIALGADPEEALASFLGTDVGNLRAAFANQNSTLGKLSDQDRYALQGLMGQLKSIQSDTNLRNQAVQKLADDFPNIMAQKIPQYSALADDATKQMMDQALNQIGAKYAAGGQLSSGATAQAAAEAGAGLGMQKLQYGTQLAGQDWQNQYNNATALQSFQQKMLGQGAAQGFNAVQNALAGNRGIQQKQAQMNFDADQANAQQSQAMWGALGSLGGTALGTALGGPVGGAAGGQLGSGLFGNLGSSNKLSLGYQGPGAGYYDDGPRRSF